MKVCELISKLQTFDPEDEVMILPDPELFIEDNHTCYGVIAQIEKENKYLDYSSIYDGGEYKDREEFINDKISEGNTLREIIDELKSCEKLNAVVIRAMI